MNLSSIFNQLRLDQYTQYLISSGLSSSSIDRKLSSISTFQKYLVKKGHLQTTTPSLTPTPPLIPKVENKGFRNYFIAATLVILIAALGFGLYTQVIQKAIKNLAYSTTTAPTRPTRQLSFQGRLTDSFGNPITDPVAINFKFYDTGTTGIGTTLYDSWIDYPNGHDIGSTIVDPDDNGIFSVIIGGTHGDEIPASVFSENAEVWLEITAGGEVMDPRQQIATVAYALNSETLQGLSIGVSGMGYKNTVAVFDNSGNLNLGETSPTIFSKSGTMGIIGQALLIGTSDGSGGSITINPDAAGQIKLVTEGTGSTAVGGFIDATNANLATGNLYAGNINNDNRGYNFIQFKNYDANTTRPSIRFSVDAYGNTLVGATLTTANISIGNTLISSNAAELNLLDGVLPTNGSIIIGNGSNLANLNIGTTNKVLISNGSTPFWADLPGGTVYTATNGLNINGSAFGLGGTLTQNTSIGTSSFGLSFLGLGSSQSLYIASSGFVGIGTTAPLEKLDINGAIRLASTGTTNPGTIRWSGSNFEGYNGSQWTILDTSTITKDPTGFPNRTDTSLSFNDANQNFTITGTNFKIYISGKEYIKNTESIAINPIVANQLYYIYYNSSGALTYSTLPWDISTTVQVATVFWTGTTGLIGEERHGLSMDSATHELIHNTIGTRYNTGLGGTFTNTTFSVAGGSYYDEDIMLTIGTQTTDRVIYRVGSTFTASAVQSSFYHQVSNVIQYDNAGTTAPVTNNNFVAYWIFGTNDTTTPIYSLMGQRIDTSLANARTNATFESLTLGNMPFKEMKLLYRVIVQRSGTNEVISDTTDFRSVSNLPSGTYVATSHNVLTGLNNDDHLQYALLAGRLGGQTLNGGTSETDTLSLAGSSAGGNIILNGTSGNVGIGTTNPGTNLVIMNSGAGSGLGQLNIKNAAGDSSGFGVENSTNQVITGGIVGDLSIANFSSGHNILFSANNGTTAQLTIRNSGNIGIGTTSDTSRLYVYGNGYTGNFFTLNDGSQDLVNISSVQSTFNNPVNLTSAGDVSFGFDLNFSNSTASYIKSAAPITIQSGESFNSSDLTLKTFNAGNIILNSANLWADGAYFGVGTTSPTATFQVTSSSYPPALIERTSALTNGTRSSLEILHTTSGDMIDGFGSDIAFGIKDSSGVTNDIGLVRFKRDGADNSGAFTIDTYSSGTNSEKFRISSAGLVGIGTTNPQYGKLEITSTTSNTGGITLYRGTGQTARSWIDANDTWLIQRGTSDTAGLVINASGNIGIGTTNPLYRLHIPSGGLLVDRIGIGSTSTTYELNITGDGYFSSNLSVGGTLTLSDTNVGTGTTALFIDPSTNVVTKRALGALAFQDSTAGTTYTSTNGLSLYSTAFGLGGTLTQNTSIGTSSFGLSFLGLGNTQSLYIANTGYVGIGTTNPIGLLQLSIGNSQTFIINSTGNVGIGTTTVYRKFAISDQGGQGIEFQPAPTTGNANIISYNRSGSAWSDFKISASNIYFGYGSAETNEAMRINSSGNIGIGTTAPGTKLDVYGNIRSSQTSTSYSQFLHSNAAGDATYPRTYFLGNGNGGINNYGLYAASGNATGATFVPTFFGVSNHSTVTTATSKQLVMYTTTNLSGIMTFTAENAGGGAGTDLFLGGSSLTGSDAPIWIKTGGNIGIGTTNATYKLEVIGNGYYSTNLSVGSTLTTNKLVVNLASASGGDNLLGFTSGTGGVVGYVDTTNWDKTSSDDYISWNLQSNGAGTTAIGSGTNVNFANGVGISLAQSGSTITINNTGTGTTYVATNGLNLTSSMFGLGGTLTQNTSIGTSSFGLSFLGLGNTQSLYIASSGYVGIGTTNPSSAKLQLSGVNSYDTTIRMTNIGATGGDFFMTTTNSSWTAGANKLLIGTSSPGSAGAKFSMDSTGNVWIGGTVYSNPSIAIQNAGSIGIGTTSPNYKLEVNGTFGVGSTAYFASTVGIGTTAPRSKLEVVGQIIATKYSDDTDFDRYYLDPANQTAGTETSLSIHKFGSIKFNAGYSGPSWVRYEANSAARIQNMENGLLLGVSNTGAIGSTISGWDSNLFLNTNGNVGIGTTNPAANLQVTNTANYVSANQNPMLQVGSGTESVTAWWNWNTATAKIISNYNYAGVDDDYNGLLSDMTLSSTTSNSQNVVSINGALTIGIGNTANHGALAAVWGGIGHRGTGTVSSAKGFESDVRNLRGGTITDASGIHATIQNSTPSVITNYYGFRLADITNTGTISNLYGAYIGDITTGTQTNTPFSFYASDPNALNYFAGNVGISTTTPTSKLYVYGNGFTGNFFTLNDGSQDLVNISSVQSTFNTPVNLASAGDVSFGYDLNFSNPTASYIKSAAPITIQSGETFNSSDLTLKTFNSGNIILSSANLWADGTYVGIGTITPAAKLEISDGANATGSYSALRLSKGNSYGTTEFKQQYTSVTNYGLIIGNTGSDYLAINGSNGNVGIGTTAPSGVLHVEQVTTTGLGLRVQRNLAAASTDNAVAYITNNNSGDDQPTLLVEQVGTGDILRLIDNGTAVFTAKDGGNVGIGTTAPNYKLQVVGSLLATTIGAGATDPNYSLYTNGKFGVGSTAYFASTVGMGTTAPDTSRLQLSGVNSYDTTIRMTNIGPTGGDFFMTTTNSSWTAGANKLLIGTSSPGSAGAKFSMDSTGNVWIGGTVYSNPSIAIQNAGSVGIGTTNPANKLVVDSGALELSGTANIFSGSNEGLYRPAAGILGLVAGGSGGLYQKAGNVGIGTTAPGQKLEVAGTLRVTSGVGTTYFDISTDSTKGLLKVGTGYIEADSNSTNFGLIIRDSGSGSTNYANLYMSSGVGSTYLQIITHAAQTSAGTGIIIRSDGNVGIGTTSPGQKFTVKGGLCVQNTTACPAEVAGQIFYDTGSSAFDLAEEYPTNMPVEPGDVLMISSQNGTVTKSTSPYDSKLIGIVSTNPNVAFRSGMSTIGGAGSQLSPDSTLVTLSGRVPVKVSLENGPITIGDPLTSSSTPGVAMKATKPGQIIGKALNSYTQPDSDNKIMAFVHLGWFGQETTSLTAEGQVNIDSNITPSVLADLGYQLTPTADSKYSVKDSIGNLVDTINTTFLSAKTLVTKLTISDTTITNDLKTATISPLSELTDTINIEGNASISGTLTASQATINDLRSDTATVSTLYADNIISSQGSFGDLMTAKVSSLRSEVETIIKNALTNQLATDIGITQTEIATQTSLWNTNIASNSATINGNLSLTGDMIISSTLSVLGQTSLNNTMISGLLSVGQIAIKDNMIDTTADILYLQPSKTGSIHFMGDSMVIASSGDIIINGNLNLNGHLTAQTASVSGDLFAFIITAKSATIDDLTTTKLNVATDSSQLIIAESGFSAIATSSAQLTTNATAGTATLPVGKTEIIIHNSKLTPNSMVYLTPVGSTNNQVVYLKNKIVGAMLATAPSITPTSTPSATLADNYFTIALDQPLNQDIDINWWIIN